MAKITRTVNPIHFEDLEPRRFEDLTRQLLYSFRSWKSIEPLGRTGADDGYDVRLIEEAKLEEQNENSEDSEVDQEQFSFSEERLWQVQCKREKSITASKITTYVEDCFKTGIPYGFILASACEFSKKTRDAFNTLMRSNGVKEFFLWGKADLEDMLFRPENDHLLFAYFGFSLGIERRKKQSKLKREITVKRKLVKVIGDVKGRTYTPILLRDINDEDYPYIKNKKQKKKDLPWKVYYCLGHYHSGIILLTRKYYAYFDKEKEEYEIIDKNNLALYFEDHWNNDEKIDDYPYYYTWNKISKDKQAHYERHLFIPYALIQEIDDIGDNILGLPVIYVNKADPDVFSRGQEYFVPNGSFSYPERIIMSSLKKLKKIKYYPKDFPTREEIEVEKKTMPEDEQIIKME